MAEKVFKKIELTGTSSKSIEDAIQNAVSRASKTIRMMRWFEVVEVRGKIEGESVDEWQATVRVAFHLED